MGDTDNGCWLTTIEWVERTGRVFSHSLQCRASRSPACAHISSVRVSVRVCEGVLYFVDTECL